MAVGIPHHAGASSCTRGILANARIAAAVHATLSAEGGKKGPHTLVEARYPAETANDAGAVQSKDQGANGDPPLIALIQGADPRIAKLESSNPRFTKEAQAIEKGQAQKIESADAADFLRAALPLMANGSKFFLGRWKSKKDLIGSFRRMNR